jgi:glycosyltransferase involved in cell wall biosynthesis
MRNEDAAGTRLVPVEEAGRVPQSTIESRPSGPGGPLLILVVGMPHSVHLAKWIGMLSGRGWDIHLFPSMDVPPLPSMRDITLHDPTGRSKPPPNHDIRYQRLAPSSVTTVRSILTRQAAKPQTLATLIARLQPHIVHSQEFQHAAYLTLEAKLLLGDRFPPWIASNWGSDIYLFGRLREHVDKIRAVLAECDYYACECERDIQLARDYGLKGEALPVVPIAGGYDLEALRPLRAPGPTSARRTIALKGYTGWAGRALTGLRAIELCGNALAGYRLAINLAMEDVATIAELICREIGIELDLVGQPAGSATYEDILRMHGRSRASIGLSISDAISTSFLEAFMLGSFPIQSNTGCASEWVEDGLSGALVHPEDPDQVAAALRRAIEDDDLVDRAAAINAEAAAKRLAMGVVQPKAVAMYEHVAAQGATRRLPRRR